MLRVMLKSCANPDFGEERAPAPRDVAFVKTPEDAAKACRDYIAKYGLGGGNWIGGQVYDGKVICYLISYNGRIWYPKVLANGGLEYGEEYKPEYKPRKPVKMDGNGIPY